MTDKQFTLDIMRSYGKQRAQEVQDASATASGTELNAQDGYIPDFQAAKAKMNMLDRHAGLTDGFVCKSSEGRVVRLLQKYDSTVYAGEPETLPAQWGFVWSQDPAKAKPFIAISTSPYMTGDCCSVETTDDTGNASTRVFRSKIENNVYSPFDYPDGWDEIVDGEENIYGEESYNDLEDDPEMVDDGSEPEE